MQRGRANIAAALSMREPTIVALHFRRIGDSLMATPALRRVRLLRPGARIFVLVEDGVKRVFEGNSAVSDILVSGPLSRGVDFWRALRLLRKLRPQIALDFLSDPRSALLSKMSGAPVRIGIGYRGRNWAFTHCVPCQDPNRPMYSAQHKVQLAEPFGEPVNTNCALEFFLRSEDEETAANLWKQKGWREERRVVALGVHSRREHKRWPAERFAEVAQRLIQECDMEVAVLAGSDDEFSAQRVLQHVGDSRAHLLQPHDLGSLAACLKRCRIFLGNDGGPKHLAVAMGTPTVTLFGDEPVEFWTPPNHPSHIVLGGAQLGKKGLASLSSHEVFEAACGLLATTH